MSNTRFDVLGLGNAIVDVIARADDDLLVRESLHKGSMTLIDEARADQLYGAMGPATVISGGSAANTIVGVASFGARTAFIGKVRDDEAGKAFSHDIRSIGVHFSTPASKEGPATARCLVLVTPDGERTMNTYLGACRKSFARRRRRGCCSCVGDHLPRGLSVGSSGRKEGLCKGGRYRP